MSERALKSLVHSLASAFAGWVTAVVIGIISGVVFGGWGFFLFAFAVGLVSAPHILLVWLVLLWPLSYWIPRASMMWRPIVCVPCGVLAGGLLICWENHGGGDEQWLILTAGTIGGVTCYVGCWLNAVDQGCPKPSPLRALSSFARRVARLGQRTLGWLQDGFSDLAGQ